MADNPWKPTPFASNGICSIASLWLMQSFMHYNDVIMGAIASQITSLKIVYSTVYSEQNIKAPRHSPLCGEFTGTGEFPAQMARNAEKVSIWWRLHGTLVFTITSTVGISMAIVFIPRKAVDVSVKMPIPHCHTTINYWGRVKKIHVSELGHHSIR